MAPQTTLPPTGTVTFLFTDIEGSTVRWDAHRAEMQEAVRRHDELLRAAIERNGGFVFKTIGDAFCAAFGTAHEAVASALDTQRVVGAADWSAVDGLRVRMAIHTGVADERDADYFGPTVNRVARLLAVGHGGQVLLSGAAKDLAQDAMPQDATLLDLGVHRLKDLSAPERVFQLRASGLQSDFPVLRSLDALPNNLLGHMTPLIGRDEELAEIETLLGQSRLVALIGPGGIGKTRTALQVAADLLRGDGDGAWFVDLSRLDDPVLVPSAIAGVFGVADEGGSRGLIDRVAAALKTKKLLIVIDNCEHVISAAADAVERLLHVCPHVRVLVTSREPLGIAGEVHYRMPTLQVPPKEATTAARVMQYAAAVLFVERARAVQRSFVLSDENAAVVAEVVRRLDGIALAIELAASRVKALSVQQLNQRLDERLKLLTGGNRTAHARQKTLHALIGWSYDLLDEPERSMLRQCAIFRGGWTLDAAEVVCIDERFPDWDSLDLISSLVDKSLVVVEIDGEEQRYRLLESTRAFALEQLDEAQERDVVAARHAGFFAEAARCAGERFWQTDSELWITQARRDLENVRAAIEWGLAGTGDAAMAAGIVADLRWLWWATARREGRILLERAAGVVTGDALPQVRGGLALTRALLDFGPRAAEPAGEATRLLAGIDELAHAEARFREGQALGMAGRLEEAVAACEEALTTARTLRAPRLAGWFLTVVAYWNGAAGNQERARACYGEAGSLLRGCNDQRRFAMLQANWADFLFAESDLESALLAVCEAEAVFRDRAAEANLANVLLNKAGYLLAMERLEEARAAAREGLELAMRTGEGLRVAWAIGHLAHLAAERGDFARATKLLGYVDAVLREFGSLRELTEQRGYARALELIRTALPEDRIAALIADGEATEQDDAVAEAMTIP